MDSSAIEIGSLAFLRMKELVGARKIDHSHPHLVRLFQSDADGTLVNPSAIVGCPINRIDNPGIFMSHIVDLFFFTEESGCRHECGQLVAKEILYGHVGGGDNVLASSLLFYFKTVGDHQA